MGNSDLLRSWATPRSAKPAANENRPSNSERSRERPGGLGEGNWSMPLVSLTVTE